MIKGRTKVRRFICAVVAMTAWSIAYSAQPREGGIAWRKTGMWEVTLRPEGKDSFQAITVHQCSSELVEPTTLLSILPGQEHCQIKVKSPHKSLLRAKLQCEVHGKTIKADIEIRGNRSVTYEGNYTVSGGGIPATGPTAFAAKWLGECGTTLRPGEMRLSNGVKVDVVRDKKLREDAHQH